MKLRPYQQTAIDDLYAWWMAHPGIEAAPILVMPTGSGKSIVLAELTRLVWDTWPEDKPRTLVITPSKELAEQDAEKLFRLMPSHIRVDFYSASVGRKVPDADVIVATIGSIYKIAPLLGNIKMVIVDECHLTNPDGAGMYRQLLDDLEKLCQFRVVGLTATPFRGNGVWLTDGKDPLFCGIAHEVKIKTLLDGGFLAPMARPVDIQTRIDTDGITISGATGDYKMNELADRVKRYLPAAADEACQLAADRRKWLAFLPTVVNAEEFADLLLARDIMAFVVCGETPKKERQTLIEQFRAGEIRCLVTVLALATGFDVPDVDCLIWCRPTISPVLYVQGVGRGMRPAEGKADCLWLDFSDTTERMGPVDTIRGRKRPRKSDDRGAPYALCDACGAQVRPASALFCPECGARLREEDAKEARSVSNAAIMSHQLKTKIVTYPVTKVTYARHRKEGSRDSLRVEYWSGLRVVAKEWVCFEHSGFARAKAENWWQRRCPYSYAMPSTVEDALDYHLQNNFEDQDSKLKEPIAITVNETGQWPEIISYQWRDNHESNGIRGSDQFLSARA